MPMPNTICGTCEKEIYRQPAAMKASKSGKVFCSHSCSQKYNNTFRAGLNHHAWRKEGLNYRYRALTYYGKKCANNVCPLEAANIYLPESMYDVDHIDENRSNNNLSNLQVLCVYCHAAKTRKVNIPL